MVKHISYNCENLSLSLQNTHKSGAHIYNPSATVEIYNIKIHRTLESLRSASSNFRYLVSNKVVGNRYPGLFFSFHTHIMASILRLTHMSTYIFYIYIDPNYVYVQHIQLHTLSIYHTIFVIGHISTELFKKHSYQMKKITLDFLNFSKRSRELTSQGFL